MANNIYFLGWKWFTWSSKLTWQKGKEFLNVSYKNFNILKNEFVHNTVKVQKMYLMKLNFLEESLFQKATDRSFQREPMEANPSQRGQPC